MKGVHLPYPASEAAEAAEAAEAGAAEGSAAAAAEGQGEQRRLRIQFQRSPAAFAGDAEGRLSGVAVDATSLEGEPSRGQRAVAVPGSTRHLSAQLALLAVGHRST